MPQFLLEHAILSGQGATANVIVTQPRRIAAISVADRVAAERGESGPGQHGSLVGYHVRLDAAMSRDTKLLFCTTGILLRRWGPGGHRGVGQQGLSHACGSVHYARMLMLA